MNRRNKMRVELLLVVQPQDLVNILNGNKTLELRKLLPKNFDGLVKKHGGILSMSGYPYVVIWCSRNCGFYLENKVENIQLTYHYKEFVKVIGNIHENKDLLKE